jgi:hypothetical protein
LQKEGDLKNPVLFGLILFCFTTVVVNCSSKEEVPAKRGFDQAYLDKLNRSERYNYDRVFEEEESSASGVGLLTKIFSGVAWFFNSFLGYIIILTLLGLLIWVLVKNSSRMLERKHLNEKDPLIELKPVDVEDKDYSKLIDAALKKQDYKMAIRFGFLSTLRYLHKKNLIEWKMEKTNLDYQFELPSGCQEPFASMTLIYERIWYGDFAANKALFNAMSHKFHDLKSIENP